MNAKDFIIWGYFLFFPIINPFIPDIEFSFMTLSVERMFHLIGFFYLIKIVFKKFGRIKISKHTRFMAIYVTFLLLNSYLSGNLKLPNVLNYSLPLFLLILFENLNYKERDLRNFYNSISILAVIIFVVSLLQLVDNSFYSGFKDPRVVMAFADKYRNVSIFSSLDFYQGCVAIGYLCVIFLFMNYQRLNAKYIFITGLLLISTLLTFTRSVWIMPLVGYIFYIYYKAKSKKFIILIASVYILVASYVSLMPKLAETEFYSQRVVSESYRGRIVSAEIFLMYFLNQNLLFGRGIDSRASGDFLQFGRPEVHNGYFEVLYQNGIIGFVIFALFWYFLYKKGKNIYERTENPVFIVFIIIFLVINLTFKFIYLNYFGFLMFIFYMNLYDSITYTER